MPTYKVSRRLHERWSEKDDKILCRMRKEGYSNETIGIRLGRSTQIVSRRASELELPHKNTSRHW